MQGRDDPIISPPLYPYQLLKKLIQCGDTSCLRPLLALARPKDKVLLQGHCHAASKRLLVAATATATSTATATTAVAKEEGVLREAVAYLSIAIMASGETHVHTATHK